MGWLDEWWKKDDPLHGMEPSLRRYLERETPKLPPLPEDTSDPRPYREQVGLKDPTRPEHQAGRGLVDEAEDRQQDPNHVPEESLFQDGRYAHLWKNYRPQAEVEERGKSDQEKLIDVVHAFKDAKASAGRAATQNCADEQWNLRDCFTNGGWYSRMTLCRAEKRQMTNCITMQTKFLKALGFATMNARTAEETERIQMHADSIYQRMKAHEVEVEQAKAEGREPPPPPSLFKDAPKPVARRDETNPPGPRISIDNFPPEIRARFERVVLEGLEGEEREMAKRGLEHDIETDAYLVLGVQNRWIKDHKARMKRQAEGKARWEDRIFKYFDFREYPEEDPYPEHDSTPKK